MPSRSSTSPDSTTVPDSTEYFVGYRGWVRCMHGVHSANQSSELKSPMFFDQSWPFRDPQEANCRGVLYEHSSPHEHCRCGLYGTYSIFNVMHGPCEAVIGLVKGWGKVIPATDGFRAQYARPVAFLDPVLFGSPYMLGGTALALTAKNYNVPILQERKRNGDSRWSLDDILNSVRAAVNLDGHAWRFAEGWNAPSWRDKEEELFQLQSLPQKYWEAPW